MRRDVLSLVSLKMQFENLGDELIKSILVAEAARRGRVRVLTAGARPSIVAAVEGFCARRGLAVERGGGNGDLLGQVGRAVMDGRHCRIFMTPGETTYLLDILPRAYGAKAFWLAQGLRTLPRRIAFAQIGTSYETLSWFQRRTQLCCVRRSPTTMSVRDPASARYLRAFGHEIGIVPDLVFALPRRRPEGERARAVFSFRDVGPAWATTLRAEVGRLARLFEAGGLRPTVTWQVSFDRGFCEWLAEELELDVSAPAGDRLSLEEAEALYGASAVVVSNRLHGLLIGAAFGATPLALTAPDHVKIHAALREAGLAEHLFTLGDRDDRSATLATSPLAAAPAVDAAFTAQARTIARFLDEAIAPVRP